MEEQVQYTTVVFKTKDSDSKCETPNELEVIYDEVKTQEQSCPATPDGEKKALCSLPHLVAAGLGITCAILAAFIIMLKIQLHTATSEHLTERHNLIAQNQQLWSANQQLSSEKADLKRKTQELTRDNWTLGVILEYKDFPVEKYCPQKECKPCLDSWRLFQSHCYLFTDHESYWDWKYWKDGREECSEFNADLVVIDSQEEQEFISKNIQKYNDANHGYWIGLKKDDGMEMWKWIDGSNLTATYWGKQQANRRYNCALITGHQGSPSNWLRASCDMKNRYICETRALIKPDEDSAALT